MSGPSLPHLHQDWAHHTPPLQPTLLKLRRVRSIACDRPAEAALCWEQRTWSQCEAKRSCTLRLALFATAGVLLGSRVKRDRLHVGSALSGMSLKRDRLRSSTGSLLCTFSSSVCGSAGDGQSEAERSASFIAARAAVRCRRGRAAVGRSAPPRAHPCPHLHQDWAHGSAQAVAV